jgi:hypothetical protein
MTWQLDTELDVDLRWIIGNGHGARICGDDRWNPLVTVMAQGHVATIGGASSSSTPHASRPTTRERVVRAAPDASSLTTWCRFAPLRDSFYHRIECAIG